MLTLAAAAATTTTVLDVHRGAVLPFARVVILLVPMLALTFYVFVIRTRNR